MPYSSITARLIAVIQSGIRLRGNNMLSPEAKKVSIWLTR